MVRTSRLGWAEPYWLRTVGSPVRCCVILSVTVIWAAGPQVKGTTVAGYPSTADRAGAAPDDASQSGRSARAIRGISASSNNPVTSIIALLVRTVKNLTPPRLDGVLGESVSGVVVEGTSVGS